MKNLKNLAFKIKNESAREDFNLLEDNKLLYYLDKCTEKDFLLFSKENKLKFQDGIKTTIGTLQGILNIGIKPTLYLKDTTQRESDIKLLIGRLERLLDLL